MTGLVFTGCTASHYRRSADKETYQIIQRAMDEIRQKEQTGREQDSPTTEAPAAGDKEPQ